MKWPLKELGEIVEIRSGSLNPADHPEEEFELYSIPGYDVGAPEILNGSGIKSNKTIVKAGDVLFSKLNPRIPRVWIVSEPKGRRQISSTEFWPLVCHERVVMREYLKYFLLRLGAFGVLSDGVEAATKSRSRIKPFQLLRQKCIFPPISEQRRIIEILSQADALNKKHAKVSATADLVLPSLFYKMFGDPASNPKEWNQATLGAVTTDFRYGTSERCDSENVGLPVLRIPNVIGDELDLSDLKYAELPAAEVARLMLHNGDILFVRTNGNRNYVGRSAVFDLDIPYLYASYLIRARLDFDRVNPWFVTFYLRTSAGRRAMSPFIRTTAGQSNISVEGLSQIPLFLPPLPLQHDFASQVLAMRKFNRRRSEVAERLECLFKNLLHRAYSGDLTAKWREAHMKELLAEMEEQAKYLRIEASA